MSDPIERLRTCLGANHQDAIDLIEKYREDAERYRLLRQSPAWYDQHGRKLWGDELDAAVDTFRSMSHVAQSVERREVLSSAAACEPASSGDGVGSNPTMRLADS